MPLRLKLLVVVHVLLSALGIAQFRLLFDVLWLPLVTAISSIAVAQTMLTGFWIGLGGSRARWRLLGWFAAGAYLALWPSLAILWLPPDAIADDTSFWNGFIPAAVSSLLLMAVFASIYMVIRLRFATLQKNSSSTAVAARPQFSIFHLLMITTVASLVMAMSRTALQSDVDSPWHIVAVYVLVFTNCIITVVAAPWAMLKPGAVWRRTLVVLACSFAAGVAVSFVFYDRMPSRQPWHWRWIFIGQAVAIGLAPALVLVVSLAIVRSCGYRLVSKRPATVAIEPLQFTPAPLHSRTANEG